MDINPSLQICGWNVNGTGRRIKGLGKNPQKSELKSELIDSSAFCPGAPKRIPSDSEKHVRVYTSSHKCHSHVWPVDTATGKTLKKRNAC